MNVFARSRWLSRRCSSAVSKPEATKQSPIKWENFIERFSQFRRGSLREQTARNTRFATLAHALSRAAASAGEQIEWRTPAPGMVRDHARGRCDILLLALFSLTLFSCSSSTPQTAPQVVTVYSTSAAQPWLPPLYACTGSSTVISRVDDSSSADIVLRVGEPEFLASPAYQIDVEEILIVTNRQSPVQNLALEEARALFAGRGEPSVQVWVYASEEDVQVVFGQFVMEGRSVTSSARLAVNPQQMSDILVKEGNAVGILPRHWKAGDAREVFTVATVPVLAITQNEPEGVIKELLACLQK